jgi:hypothetical protein
VQPGPRVIPANRQRNYLQSALYVAIVGVLAAVLLERLLTYAEVAEKAAMEATISRLHTALYAQMAYLALRGEYEAIDSKSEQSPFAVADVKSSNYLGEFDGIPAGGGEGGKWFYDRLRHELVYVPNLKRYFSSAGGEPTPAVIRYRVEVLKASKYAYTGVAIRPVNAVRWDPAP